METMELIVHRRILQNKESIYLCFLCSTLHFFFKLLATSNFIQMSESGESYRDSRSTVPVNEMLRLWHLV